MSAIEDARKIMACKNSDEYKSVYQAFLNTDKKFALKRLKLGDSKEKIISSLEKLSEIKDEGYASKVVEKAQKEWEDFKKKPRLSAEEKQELTKIVDKIKEVLPTKAIYLFGSYAYGNPNQYSDYDIYIILSKDIDSFSACTIALNNISNMTSKRIDVLAATNDIFMKSVQRNLLEKKVMIEGVKLYEQ